MKKITILIIFTTLITLFLLFGFRPFFYSVKTLKPAKSLQEIAIENKIQAMSLEEKTGALFIIGFNGLNLTDETRSFINQHHFRHFLLFSKNISNPEQLRDLTSSLREATASSLPSLITIDQEGGQVARMAKPGLFRR